MRVSHFSVKAADKVHKQGVPNLVDAVAAGKVAVSAAARIATLPAEQQEQVAAGIQSGLKPKDALAQVHETVRRLDNDAFYVTAIFARWHAATATLTWANCGHPPPYLVDAEGNLAELESPQHPALGSSNPNPNFKLTKRQLGSGERLILVTDGIIDRKMEGGGTFGVEGIKAALERAESATAASTAMAIQKGVTECWREPLEDDATVVVMAVE